MENVEQNVPISLDVLVAHMPFAENALRTMAEKAVVGGPTIFAVFAQFDGTYGVEKMLGTKFENNRLVTSYGYVSTTVRAGESVAVPMVKEAWPTCQVLKLAAAKRNSHGELELARFWFPPLVIPELPEPQPTEEQVEAVNNLWSAHQKMVYREAKEEFLAVNDGEPVIATQDFGTCTKCGGSGRFIDGKGRDHGPCYRCKGKCEMDGADLVRNTVYWKYRAEEGNPEPDWAMNGNHVG